MDRRRLEQGLDALIRNNRVTIAITFPLVGVGLLVGATWGLLPRSVAFDPVLIVVATTVMALPLIGGLLPLVDRRLALGLVGLALFSWTIEVIGVRTGQPYGSFAYTTDLGPMLFGIVPLALPIFYLPILVNGYLLTTLVLGDRARSFSLRVVGTLGVVLVMDLVLDPGAVALGFWAWDDPTRLDLVVWTTSTPGSYYDVPVHNLLGWVLSGTVAVTVLTLTLDHDTVVDRLEGCEYFLDDLISFGLFWGLVNLLFGNIVPATLAVVLLAVLFRAEWFDFAGLGGGAQSRGGLPRDPE